MKYQIWDYIKSIWNSTRACLLSHIFTLQAEHSTHHVLVLLGGSKLDIFLAFPIVQTFHFLSLVCLSLSCAGLILMN